MVVVWDSFTERGALLRSPSLLEVVTVVHLDIHNLIVLTRANHLEFISRFHLLFRIETARRVLRTHHTSPDESSIPARRHAVHVRLRF